MIKRLYVDNYKCFVNFELNFQPLTLLLGRNGAGKTSVLDVMFALRELLSGRAKISDAGIFPEHTLTAWQSREVQAVEIEVQIEDEVLVYRLEIEHDPNEKQSRIINESLTGSDRNFLFRCETGEVTLYRDNLSEGPKYSADWSESALARVPSRRDNTRLTRFLEYMRKLVVCGMYPANFDNESAGYEEKLDRDAHNFSAWYHHHQLEHPGRIENFKRMVKEVLDGFDGIRLEKTGVDRRELRISFLEQSTKRYELSLGEVSDGQRALIALYALIELSAGMSYSLFLDEPENYVALAEIQPWLIELADRCGDSIPQAIVCSHHPELIDYLGGSYGVLLDREQSGVTKVKNLSDVLPNSTQGLKLSEIVARGWEL